MVDKARLLDYIERIEAYDDQMTDCRNARKVILDEAKAEGINPKGLQHIIRQRKKDRDQIAEEHELFTEYEKAVGLR